MLSEELLDHFRNPRNVGELKPPAIVVEVSNPACGDILRLSAHVENGSIGEVRYQVRGCTASIAAGSALTELLAGRTLQDAARVGAGDVEKALREVAAESRHVTVLCADAVKALVKAAAK